MASTFAFVDNFAIDDHSRRSIRSHVMRGKNTTRARATKQRNVAPAANKSLVQVKVGSAIRPKDDGSTEKRPIELVLHNSAGSLTPRVAMPSEFHHLQDAWSGVSFPVPVNTHLRHLVSQFYMSYARYIYPTEFCVQQDVIDSPWFKFTFEDEGYCLGVIAISTAYWDMTRGRKKLSPDYKLYFSKCLAALNKKLSGDGAGDTSTVALITGLCILAMTLGDHSSLKIHVEGLRMVVKHRGGIRTMSGDPLIMEKVQRADIELSLVSGSPAAFASDAVQDDCILLLPASPGISFPSLASIERLHPGLAQAAQDVHILTRYLAKLSEGHGDKLRPSDFAYHITHSFTKVLALGSIGTSAFADPAAELVHLTLAAILSVLTVQFGVPNEKRYDVLVARLVTTVDDILRAGSSLHTVMDPLLMNWVLHILPATVLRESEHHWVIPKMIFVRDLIGPVSWQGALEAAQAYPWVPDFHDKHIRRLWFGSRRSPLFDETTYIALRDECRLSFGLQMT